MTRTYLDYSSPSPYDGYEEDSDRRIGWTRMFRNVYKEILDKLPDEISGLNEICPSYKTLMGRTDMAKFVSEEELLDIAKKYGVEVPDMDALHASRPAGRFIRVETDEKDPVADFKRMYWGEGVLDSYADIPLSESLHK